MNVVSAVIEVKVTKKALREFKEVIEAETGFEVTNPLKLMTACLQFDARDPAGYAFLVTDSDILRRRKPVWPGLKKKRK